MARSSSAIDEYTLLCERCGYVIEGLQAQRACPECGNSIRKSLPRRRLRLTSAFPKRWPPGPLAMVRHARFVFDNMPLDRRVSLQVLGTYVGGCWFVAGAAIVFHSLWSVTEALAQPQLPPARAAFGWVVLRLFILICSIPALVWGLSALTWIEILGIRVYSKRRRWRLTSEVSLAICAHAASAWMLAVIGVALASLCVRMLRVHLDPDVRRWLTVSGFLPGLITFETLVYIGMRRCKFANRLRDGS